MNGIRQNLPITNIDGIMVYLSGKYVKIDTIFNVTVAFDGVHWVKITLPSTYWNTTCGLCGNFDGNPKNDLYLMNGSDVSHAKNPGTIFGNSWQVENRNDDIRLAYIIRFYSNVVVLMT